MFQESEKSTSSERLVPGIQKLQIPDESYLPSSETASTTSSSGEDAKYQLQKAKLNACLEQCNVEPLVRHWKDWSKANERTEERYVRRPSEIVKSVLSVVYPENYVHLWKEIKVSSAMDKLMGTDSLQLSSHSSYLEAFSEAYKNAASLDTCRQVLSIMTGVASYRDISRCIPGLTQHRYTIANLHRLQHGRAAPLPMPQLKIDRKQLDHFLAYITSPHVVQDLPSGEKTLKLSSGRVLQVPNVIRMMIPQRITQQYIQYCSEIGFVPFSERTMFRILSECGASVRKSLQGFDYIGAEGTKAFDNLSDLIKQTCNYGDSDTVLQENLKAGKLYLKSDFKVINVGN